MKKTYTVTLDDSTDQFQITRKIKGFNHWELLGILEYEKNVLEVFMFRSADKNRAKLTAPTSEDRE
jgi:hypothetical protein